MPPYRESLRDRAIKAKKSRRAAAIKAKRSQAMVSSSAGGGYSRRSVVPFAPFPASMRATLRYCSYYILDTSIATPMRYQLMHANGCHDPDASGVGHQPYGWDEYKNLYD